MRHFLSFHVVLQRNCFHSHDTKVFKTKLTSLLYKKVLMAQKNLHKYSSRIFFAFVQRNVNGKIEIIHLTTKYSQKQNKFKLFAIVSNSRWFESLIQYAVRYAILCFKLRFLFSTRLILTYISDISPAILKFWEKISHLNRFSVIFHPSKFHHFNDLKLLSSWKGNTNFNAYSIIQKQNKTKRIINRVKIGKNIPLTQYLLESYLLFAIYIKVKRLRFNIISWHEKMQKKTLNAIAFFI